MRRTLIAILCAVVTLAAWAQARFTVVLVIDSQRGVKQGAYGDALGDLRNSGVFSRKRGLRQEIEVLDFSRQANFSHLKAWGLSRESVPYLAIGELNSSGGVTKLSWSSKVGSPQEAVAVLRERLTGQTVATHTSASDFVNPRDGSVMVNVPAGEFLMGEPASTRRVAAYQISKYEVTNAQYARFITSSGYGGGGSQWQQYASKWGERAPVVCVAWDDADAYCRWAGLRLPSDAEWERAARGTDGRTYPWGNEWDSSRAVCGTDGAKAVGSKPTGVSPAGCLDMAGNVEEWTDDWYDSTQQTKVYRGGGWGDVLPGLLRCSFRDRVSRGYRGIFLGFRCARPLSS